MKRIIPNDVYRGLPCSVVATGCALETCDISRVEALQSPFLHSDGYLSLRDMNALVRANLAVAKKVDYRRGERPVLYDWAQENLGKRAIICVLGHYLYFDGKDYHSFLWNGRDDVVCVWYLA